MIFFWKEKSCMKLKLFILAHKSHESHDFLWIFPTFFLPIRAPGKMSSHFEYLKVDEVFNIKDSYTPKWRGFAGRDTRNRLEDKGKVNTSARGHGNTATNMWAIFSHCVGIFLNHQSLPNGYLHVFCCNCCKWANVSFFQSKKYLSS